MTDEKKPKAPAKKAVVKTPAKKAAAKTAAAPKKSAAPKKAAAPKAAPKAAAAAEAAVAAGIPEVVAAPVEKRRPTHDQISYRAYFIFLERNGAHGHDENDWLRAERELLELL